MPPVMPCVLGTVRASVDGWSDVRERGVASEHLNLAGEASDPWKLLARSRPWPLGAPLRGGKSQRGRLR
jgi:hypothetical protein